ncbi:chloride channel protein [Pedobacter frigoris]|uniref:Chloride channel protein n=1 Tax=Pedobacter frigoris TaxID=2571272 RepID=A0A4U1CFR0_9SPHI|nr:chloride channel protein [Pedobacter frigoris]TKC03740.1 chloride channel protein [Pedobacter frigoris]
MQRLNANIFFLCKWTILLLIVGGLSGTLSALFLTLLNLATNFREDHSWLLYLLPLAGLFIGWLYHDMGKGIEGGNNLIFDAIHNPKDIIPFKMTPMVLAGTVLTHLFGGSAGREGTALQMSAAAADQFHKPFKLSPKERTTLLIVGLSAGFASVFGTPLAGAVFGIEVLLISGIPFVAVIPALIGAYLASYVTALWGVGHTHYHIDLIPSMTLGGAGYSIVAGIFFSAAAIIFVRFTHQISTFSKKISYPPFRPLIGGVVVICLALAFDTNRYLGLGIPIIVDAFQHQALPQDFILKIIFTGITLGAGFKGGEVTPLFFIGATLGSALSFILPLPVGLMAGMGFVAVFGAAAKTPLACIIMAMELFGISCGAYVAIACVVSFLFSGSLSIYNIAENKTPKHLIFGKFSLTPLFLYFRAILRK